MGHALWIARIGEHTRYRIEKSDTTIELAHQQHTPVAGDLATVEIHFNAATLYRFKFDSLRSTIWHRRSLR